MKYISLGLYSSHYLYLALNIIFYLVFYVSLDCIKSRSSSHPIMSMTLYIPAILLIGILELISKIRQHRKHKPTAVEELKETNTFEFITPNKMNKTQKIIIICFIIGSFLQFCIGEFFISMSELFPTSTNNILTHIFTLLIICIACAIFLSISIYKHQFLGIVLTIIGLLLSNKSDISLKFDKKDLFCVIKSVALSIIEAFAYIVMTKYYLSPFKIVFVAGIIITILHFIFVFILIQFFSVNWEIKISGVVIDNLSLLFSEISNDPVLIFYYCLFLFCAGGQVITRFLVIYHISPIGSIIVEYAISLFIWIIYLFKKYKISDLRSNIVEIIGVFIISLGFIIYNEIIILYFCGIDKNTKKSIKEREMQEQYIVTMKETRLIEE